jgi:hypothetical protein
MNVAWALPCLSREIQTARNARVGVIQIGSVDTVDTRIGQQRRHAVVESFQRIHEDAQVAGG